jgi:hypothetical protein
MNLGEQTERGRAIETGSGAEFPAIQITGTLHEPSAIVSGLAQHLFHALSSKATSMLRRRLCGKRCVNMNPADRKAHILKIATEIATKIEARLIAFGPCYHPEDLVPLRLWDGLKRRAKDRAFLRIFGRTIQSPRNPVLNKTEIVIVYLWACRFCFGQGKSVSFHSLSDERQRQIVSGVLGKRMSLDGYRKARRRIGKSKSRDCIALSGEDARQVIAQFRK